MKKVTTINLNGTAYQVEEAGYDKLKAYLDQAAAALASNPDKDEILADLEQAIAEKSRSYLTAAKNVISTEEIDRIIASMGPVEGAPAADSAGSATGPEAGSSSSASSPKKLYLLREGAIIMGVCNGLAAYFNIDVTVMRIIFVVLSAITSGGFIGVYIVLAIIIPYANTPEEKTAAHGMAYTAQQLINRAKNKYETFAAGKGWENKGWDKSEWMKKHLRHQEMKERRRQEKRAYRAEMRRAAYARNPLWDTLNALIWLGVLCFIGWFAYTHFAEIQALINNVVLYFNNR